MQDFTPENITKLKRNEIFVFGSNLAGNHIGGAAKVAKDLFGAKDGIGDGITGKSYAFPTLNGDMSKRSIDELKVSAEKFVSYAKNNPKKTFLLTKVGCGIAGFSDEEIKPLFYGAPSNVIKPEGWNKQLWKLLRTGLLSDSGKNCKWKIGKWKKEDKIKICHSGFHASEKIIDALTYVKGEIMARVEVRGLNEIESDKECWSEMKIIKIYKWTKEESLKMAIFSAEQVIEIFEKKYPKDNRPREAINIAKKVLNNPAEAAARAAACVAARAADAVTYAAADAVTYAAYAATEAAADNIKNTIENYIISIIE